MKAARSPCLIRGTNGKRSVARSAVNLVGSSRFAGKKTKMASDGTRKFTGNWSGKFRTFVKRLSLSHQGSRGRIYPASFNSRFRSTSDLEAVNAHEEKVHLADY